MERKTSYCTNCGNIINFNSKFCNICGAPTIIAEKMKKLRVSKVYSLIMLAITALVVAFVPSVTLSGSDIQTGVILQKKLILGCIETRLNCSGKNMLIG